MAANEAALHQRASAELWARPYGRPWLLRLSALSISLALTLAAAELLVRGVHPVELHPSDTFLVRPEPGAQAGSMTLIPAVVVRHTTREFDIWIKTNREGFRDREFPREKTPGVFRIMALGDSQTFGYGVDAKETYAKVLERLLNERARRRVEVINTGVPSTGTAHQLWQMEEKGWAHHPDLVALGFFHNDIADNIQQRIYRIRDGRVVRVARPAAKAVPMHRVLSNTLPENDFRQITQIGPVKAPSPPFLIRHSHLARFVRQSLANIRAARAEDLKKDWVPARKQTRVYLRELLRQCAARKIPLAVVLIPSLQQDAERGKIRTLSEKYRDIMEGVLTADQVVEVWPAFERQGFRKMFFPRDMHLTAQGHRLIAEALAERLMKIEPRLTDGG